MLNEPDDFDTVEFVMPANIPDRSVTSEMSWVWSDAANPEVAAETYAAMASEAPDMSDKVWV